MQDEQQELYAQLRKADLIEANIDPAKIDLDVAETLLELSPVADVSRAHLLHLAG